MAEGLFTMRNRINGSRWTKWGVFTPKQGQYLAFIYYYSKINGRSPSEADMERYFKVTAPSHLLWQRAHALVSLTEL